MPKAGPPWWPQDCQDPDSCARHERCGYLDCRHEERYIAPEVELARLRTASAALLALIDAVPYRDRAELRLSDAVPQVAALREVLAEPGR